MQKAEQPFLFQNTLAPLDQKSGNTVTLGHLLMSGKNQSLDEVPEASYYPSSFTNTWHRAHSISPWHPAAL